MNLKLVVKFALAMSISTCAWANDSEPEYKDPKEKRRTDISFDGDAVEATGKNPGNPGSLAIKDPKRRKKHLYRRGGFFDKESFFKDLRYEL